jgi:hypothetical protein
MARILPGVARATLAATLCALFAAACGNEGDDKADPKEVGEQSHALLIGRTVRVDFISPSMVDNATGPVTVDVRHLDRYLYFACHPELKELAGLEPDEYFPPGTPSADVPITGPATPGGTTRGVCTTSDLHPAGLEHSDGRWSWGGGWVHTWFHGCMGDMALRLAESPAGSSFADNGSGSCTGEDCRLHEGRVENADLVIPPPSASDRASLYILAAIHHQAAAVQANQLLTTNCSQDAFNDKIVTMAEEPTSVGEIIASTLAHSMARMVEAGERAQQYIGASAAAAGSQANDREARLVQSWRGAHDSRLEGAAIFVNVPTRMFENQGYKQIYQQSNPTTKQLYLTTNPLNHQSGFTESDATNWWLSPTPLSANSSVFASWKTTTGPTFSSNSSSGATPAPPGLPTTGHQPWSLIETLGYGATQMGTGAGRARLVRKHGVMPGGTVYGYRFGLSTDDFPAWATTSANLHYVFTAPPAGEYPVYVDRPLTELDELAEDLIRSNRLNPLQDGSGIANDLLAVLNSRYKSEGQPNPFPSADLLVTGLFDTSVVRAHAVLKAAGERIKKRAHVLGHALVPIPGTTAPVLYSVPPSRGAPPSPPAVIYARTATAGAWDVLNTATEHAIAGTMSRLLVDYHYRLRSMSLPEDMREVLDGAAAYASTFVGPELSAGILPDSVSIGHGPDAPTTFEESFERYEAFAGLDGLECATSGEIAGMKCNPEDYKFRNAHSFSPVAAPYGSTGFRIWAANAPPIPYGLQRGATVTTIDPNVLIFVTRKTPAGREVVVSYYPGNISTSTAVPTLGPGLREQLSLGLAADPDDPEAGLISCAGVPHNAKVLLEDELIAVNREDQYDESFRYYLNQAAIAAKDADELGNQVIRQGLEMDLRAEAALEELEDLCGGEIDIAALEKAACNGTWRCDLVKMLEDSDAVVDEELQGTLDGARACFGIGPSSEPVTVAVGDQPLCGWTYGENRTADPKYYMCQPCPENADCPEQCPMLTNHPDSGLEPCENEATDADTTLISDLLGVWATRKDFYAEPEEDDQTAWLISRHVDQGNADSGPPWILGHLFPRGEDGLEQWRTWVTDRNLSSAAFELGYFKDFESRYVTVNNGGSPIADLEQLFLTWDGLESELADEMIEPEQKDPYYHMAWPCGAVNKKIAEMCDYIQGVEPDDVAWPLICGHMCGFVGDEDRTQAMRDQLSLRLTAAVKALKIVTGSSWANVIEPSRAQIIALDDALDDAGPSRRSWLDMFRDRRTPSSVQRLSPTHKEWTEAFLLGDFEYAGYENDAAVFYGTPPAFTQSAHGRCVSVDKGLSCQYLASPSGDDTAVGPPSIWNDKQCIKKYQQHSSSTMGDTSSETTTTTNDEAGCAAVATFLEKGEDDIYFKRTVNEVTTYESWCVGLQVHTKIDRLVRKDIHKYEKLDYEGCFPTKADAEAFADEVRGGALQALAEGRDMRACNAANKAKVCAALTTLEPLGLVDKLASFFRSSSSEVQPLGPTLKPSEPTKKNTDVENTVFGLDFLDGLALARLVSIQNQGTCDTLWRTSPEITGLADFKSVRRHFECSADRVELQLSRMTLPGIPRDIISALKDASQAGAFVTQRGEYGSLLAKLITAAQNLGRQAGLVSQATRNLALEFELGEAKLKAVDLNVKISNIDSYINALNAGITQNGLDSLQVAAEIQRLRLRQSIESIATNAAVAAGNAVPAALCGIMQLGCSSEISPGAITAAGLQAANAATTIALETEVAELQGQENLNQAENAADQLLVLQQIEEKLATGRELSELEKQTILVEIKQRVLDKADAINEASVSLNETYGEIQSLLAQLNGVRAKARRAAAKALMLETDGMGRQYHVNTTMRATMNTLKVRYERARDAAVRLAHLARRAIEQKLALDLSKVTTDIGPVQAPSEWIDSVCTLSGINYDEIRNVESTNNDAGESASGSVVVDENGRHYADAYVGEYVSKLEQLVEAYRSKYPFGDGPDTMVVSLRDELLGITKTCDVTGPNLLFDTERGVGEHWYTECDAASCLAARAVSSGPFQCSGLTNSEGLELEGIAEVGDNGAHGACDTIGNAGAVQLRYIGGRDEESGSASSSAATAGDVVAIEGLEIWTRPEECDLDEGECIPASSDARGSSVPAGVTAPTRVTNPDGGELLQLGGGARLTATSSTLFTNLTYTFVARATPGLVPWVVDVPRTGGQVDRYKVEFSSLSELIFSELIDVTNAPGLPNPSTRAVYSELLDPNELHLISVRATAHGKEVYINGKRVTHDLTPIVGAPLAGDVGSGTGELGETLAFGRALNQVELATVHTYLGARYGIAVHVDRPAVMDGLISWVRADQCSNVATARYCMDMARVDTNYAVVSSLTVGGGVPAWNYQPGLPRTSPSPISIPGTSEPTVGLTVLVASQVDRNGSTGVLLGTNGWTVRTSSTELQLIGAGAPTISAPLPPGPIVAGLRADGRAVQLLLNGRVVGARPLTDAEIVQRISALPASIWGSIGTAYESLMFDRALDNEQLQSVHAYLTQRYALTLPTAAVEAPRYVQSIQAEAGEHLLTWYEPTPCSAAAKVLPVMRLEGQDTEFLGVEYCIDQATPAHLGTGRPGVWLRNGWSRRGTVLAVARRGLLTVGFEPNVPRPAGSAPYPADFATDAEFVAAAATYWDNVNTAGTVTFAAPQLERVEGPASAPPSPYFPTDENLTAPLGQCADLDGEVFNSSPAWTKACDYYCPYGTGKGCEEWADTTNLPKRCYRQIQFHISMEDIETGRLIPQGGFALGNFNYRFDKFAVNVVGTAVKNCGTSALPQPCYANNFLQFTLHHDEPFRVRNHDGKVYYAPLHPGRVQQGKALAAERYLTNPMSSADRGMLEDYWRTELRGRPLEGNYTLRIYESEEVDWTKLEDIQLAVKYRYWTRFE